VKSYGREDTLQNAKLYFPTVYFIIKLYTMSLHCYILCYYTAHIIRPHGEPPFPIRVDSLCNAKTYYTRAWYCSCSPVRVQCTRLHAMRSKLNP